MKTDLIKAIKEDNIQDVELYHGSKGGIKGNISPQSRERCDFGRGFYMGTDPEQAKSLVSGDDMPYYYKLSFKLSEIPRERILILENDKWLNTILACRHVHPDFDKLQIAKTALHRLNKFDVIIGAIADDKMREAMSAFIDNALTDKGLKYCLTKVDYGLQVVAKTDFACSKIDIIDNKPLKGFELQNVINNSARQRMECRNIVNIAKMEYSDQGRSFYSYIKHEKYKEHNYER